MTSYVVRDEGGKPVDKHTDNASTGNGMSRAQAHALKQFFKHYHHCSGALGAFFETIWKR